VRRALRAFPTLLRVGLAEAVAYRAEMFVWLLTTTMPLVMMALWTAVSREGPFQQFSQEDFVAYYLAALVVRNVTSCWVAWQMNQEIRTGVLSLRLLRPIHPFVAYASEHIAAIPLRTAIALPAAVIMLIATNGKHVSTDPLVLLAFIVSLAGAWMITFFSMVLMGSLAMYIDRTETLWQLWFGLFAVLSGYLVPIQLMPAWVGKAAEWLPFRYQLGFCVELLIGKLDRGQAFLGLAVQYGIVLVIALGALAVWRRGLRRFEAFGA
jgi:ABC-2 type transport system permease protein